MFAIRHPAVRTLWFDFDACTWTLDPAKRTTFANQADATEWATLPRDGGVVVSLANS